MDGCAQKSRASMVLALSLVGAELGVCFRWRIPLSFGILLLDEVLDRM
jgi:hypothetical protein